MYRYVATSVEGLIQQIAVQYVAHEYSFYVTGRIPDGKDPQAIDNKFLKRYGISISRSTRLRRRKAGRAVCQYIRFDNQFVLLAAKGKGRFFEPAQDGESVRDGRGNEVGIKNIKRTPLKLFGYSIAHRNGRVSVRISQDAFKKEKSFFERKATTWSAFQIKRELEQIPFERYAPIRSQLLTLLRAINRKRRACGFDRIELDDLQRIDGKGQKRSWLSRSIYLPFGTPKEVSELSESILGNDRLNFEEPRGA